MTTKKKILTILILDYNQKKFLIYSTFLFSSIVSSLKLFSIYTFFLSYNCEYNIDLQSTISIICRITLTSEPFRNILPTSMVVCNLLLIFLTFFCFLMSFYII